VHYAYITNHTKPLNHCKVFWVAFDADYSPSISPEARMDFQKAVNIDRMVGIKELMGE